MRNRTLTALVCIVIAVWVNPTVGQQDSEGPGVITRAAPISLAGPPTLSETPDATPVLIDFSVLEIDPKLGLTLDVVKSAESIEMRGAIELLGIKSHDDFVRSLVETQAAKVLSRPKIITLVGQSAQVHVGQEVAVAVPGVPDEKRMIGLKLNCRPVISDGKLRIELDCENSKLGDDQQIRMRKLNTEVSLDWGNTVAVSGIGKDLLLLLTPRRVEADSVHETPIFPSPDAARAAEAQAITHRQIAEIQNVFAAVDSASVERIELRDDQILIEAKLPNEEQDKIPSLLQGFAKLAPLEVSSVSTSITDHGVQLKLQCQLSTAKMSRPDGPFQDLGPAIKALFPDQSIELAFLPQAVVLRGDVDQQTAKQIVEIAEQYFPTVINHMVSSDRDVAATPTKVRPVSLRRQMDGLQSEVKLLRAEVRRLIDVLKSKSTSTTSSSSTASQPKPDSVPVWKLTLSEALSIAKQNLQDVDSGKSNQMEESVANRFRQLRLLQTQAQAIRDQQKTEQELRKRYLIDGGGDSDAFSFTIGMRRNSVAQKSIELKLREAQAKLRELIGLSAQDGRRIEAVADPTAEN